MMIFDFEHDLSSEKKLMLFDLSPFNKPFFNTFAIFTCGSDRTAQIVQLGSDRNPIEENLIKEQGITIFDFIIQDIRSERKLMFSI
jgi:hypothetical protein